MDKIKKYQTGAKSDQIVMFLELGTEVFYSISCC